MSEIKDNHRSQQVLKILVERYIQSGCPIGSKTIADEYALGLSPATIRNILADLEDAGYIISPHTSSGRVPTERGYRFFVNSLLEVKPLEGEELTILKNKLDPDQDTSRLVQSASDILSGITQMIGIVSLPRHDRLQLRQVEFLPLSGQRVLVILVLNNREVQNRIIHADRIYTPSELQQAANYLNMHFSGKDLLVVREELLNSMQHDRDHMTSLMQAAIDVANKAFSQTEESRSSYMMTGQNNLLRKESNVERMHALFDAFAQKQDILNLLDSALEADGIQIFIGKESGYQAFDECSIITTSYSVDGQLIGSLGIIGPKRMPYERVISAVDVTAKLLSAALNQGS
jgi:heat-inducible transcriptional repressor